MGIEDDDKRPHKRGNPFAGTATLEIVRDWDEFSGSDFLDADNSGVWTQNGIPADPGPYIPLNYRHVFQHWDNGHLVDTKDAHEFDLKELNDAIPKEEWTDQYGRPPWQRTKQVVLLNVKSGAQVLFSGSNIRNGICADQLVDKIRSRGFLHGRIAAPIVELSNVPFNTQFGMQKRGDFKVVDQRWIDLSGDRVLTGAGGLKQLPEPTLADELNDAIPDFGAKDDDEGVPWNDDLDDILDDEPQVAPSAQPRTNPVVNAPTRRRAGHRK